MKLIENEVVTSGELMEEFFNMSPRMINNVSEKVRYEKICEYLIAAGAEQRKNIFQKHSHYQFLEWQEELYLIPKQIFDELDESWLQELKAEEDEQVDQKSSKVAL